MMIVVFWLEQSHMDEYPMTEPHYEHFKANELSQALKFAEDLRAKRKQYDATIAAGHAASKISHICLQSEMTDSVGQAGVGDPKPDYDWYKRRIDPQQKLGRESGDKNVM